MALLFLLLPLALVGHGFLWVVLINRSHARVIPVWLCRAITVASFALAGLIPVMLVAGFRLAGWSLAEEGIGLRLPWPVQLYLSACSVLGIVALGGWIRRKTHAGPPAVQIASRSSRLTLLPSRDGAPPQPHGDGCPSLLVRMIGNEILQLDVVQRELELPRLSPALDGLTILHFSDLHFTGRVDQGYFRELVRQCNALDPDLVAITGDLIDDSRYIAWIPQTLGKLVGRYGVYFVLGNHDVLHDVPRIRGASIDCGLVDLGGRWIEIEVRGQRVVMAGNELPWLPPAADLRPAPPPSSQGGPPRIALGHGPDQLPWAVANEIDLFLVGHTHGGQIRIPVVGPIFSPCLTGVRYARGTFYAPPTVLHVTQGVSARVPVRINCPPEIVKLTLRARSGVGGPAGKQ